MIARILCRLGLHSWKPHYRFVRGLYMGYIVIGSMDGPLHTENRCRRCHARKVLP